jgi:3-ketoacyl-CoA synthase
MAQSTEPKPSAGTDPLPKSKSSPETEISDLKQSVKLKYVKLGYHYMITHFFNLLLCPIVIAISVHLSTFSTDDILAVWSQLHLDLISIVLYSTLLILLSIVYFLTRPRPVYLVDFACFKPDDKLKVTRTKSIKCLKLCNKYTEENIQFQKKILERSGLGDETYLTEAITTVPAVCTLEEARKEVETDMFGALDELFAKIKIKMKDIGILIVNSSTFNPTPSLSSIVINHYKLRENIISYNLGGMGCSAGLISIDLAKDLLQTHSNSFALVVSVEVMNVNCYFGNDRSMLVTNTLFRVGCAAILLSNRRSDRWRSKYQLQCTMRTHKGADDNAFTCVWQKEDKDGNVGISLSKSLMTVAGDALKTNITTLGPLVLPMSEQLLFFATLVLRRVLKMKIKPYIPDFKLAFEHFCIHAGGRGVLDELENNLQLSQWHLEPSRMTLYRFGNTSSSSLWYELAYTEAKGRIRRGDRTWQIAFGSGFKCNSAVWKALRTINPAKERNPWTDEIDKFPVLVPKVSPIME